MPYTQLVGVSRARQDTELGNVEQLDLLGRRGGKRQGLPGNALAVLEPGVAEVAHLTAEPPGQPLERLECRQIPLLDLEVDVLALATGAVERHLLHDEVLQARPDDASDSRKLLCQIAMGYPDHLRRMVPGKPSRIKVDDFEKDLTKTLPSGVPPLRAARVGCAPRV